MTSTLIIPTLNEIDGVKAIMPLIDKKWCTEIIIADGGSTDGTVEWLEENGWWVFRQSRKGLGAAYREALSKTKGEIVLTFSPDGNSVPSKIPELLKEMEKGLDMVIVSRYLDGGKSEDDDMLTSWGNPLFTFMINRCFGGRYTDSLVIFRAYKRELLERLKIDAEHLTYEAQISIRAAKYKAKIGEIPGPEPKRIGGERKMHPLYTGLDILREIYSNLTTNIYAKS